MKQILSKLFAGFAFVALAAMASAAGYEPNFHAAVDIPSAPTVIAASSTSNIVTSPITVRQGSGQAFFATINHTNASTATATFHFDVSYDGSTFTTTQPLKFAVVGNGTTAVVGYTNFPPSVLDNVRQIKLSAIQNAHTAALFVTNVVQSRSNQP